MSRRLQSLVHRLAWVSLLILSTSACDTEDKITVQNMIEEPPNQPPVIVDTGPDLAPGGITLISDGYYTPGLDLWVLVGDPDGLDDISIATAKVDSVRLLRYILRPDTSTSSCTQFSYAPGETISTEAILAVPHTFPGVEFRPLSHTQGGLYTAEAFGGMGYTFSNFLNAANHIHSWTGGCGGQDGLTFPIVVEAPVLPEPKTAIVSLFELEFVGITVTVYDKIGTSATTTLPDWHITFVVRKEKSAI